jgi:hypothetical protein
VLQIWATTIYAKVTDLYQHSNNTEKVLIVRLQINCGMTSSTALRLHQMMTNNIATLYGISPGET